jgi:hypothetical protein
MLRRCLILACVFASSIAGSSIFAQVNITDGTSSYFWDPAAPQSTMLVDQTAGNIMFEDMWIVRYTENGLIGSSTLTAQLNGDTSQAGVQFLGTVNSGNTATTTWNINSQGQLGGFETMFTLTLVQTVSTDANGAAQLSHQMVASNFLNGSEITNGSDLDLFFFNDFDIPTFSDNSAVQMQDGTDSVIAMQSGDGFFATTTGFDATNFQLRAVGNGTRLSDAVLNGEIFDLDNSGSPLLNTDINSMFQWQSTVVVGGTQTFLVFTTAAQAIPEPASAGLLALIGMIGLGIRRRR